MGECGGGLCGDGKGVKSLKGGWIPACAGMTVGGGGDKDGGIVF